MDVVHLRWPAERGRRERLRSERQPRLLLVDGGGPPPGCGDCFEDWIRLPASEADLQARAESLVARCQQHLGLRPTLDEGVLRVGDDWVSLSPLEARLTSLLLKKMGAVVSREALARAGWPAGPGARNTLDVHLARLRRRLDAVGLSVHTVRSRGYLLELSGSCQQQAHEA
ncbi:MAG: winged helix-turn-helix domain-containing protein [Actinobacteria bacterium]|nr:winged helix-turn-helix domain-containing protein [Actinomycetota bacterium]